jgi:hypothetical protein
MTPATETSIYKLFLPPVPTLHVIISQGYLTDQAICFQLRTCGAELVTNPRSTSSLKDVRHNVANLVRASKEKHLIVKIYDYCTLKWIDIKTREAKSQTVYYVCDGVDQPVHVYSDYLHIECDLMQEYSDLIIADINLTMGDLGKKKDA